MKSIPLKIRFFALFFVLVFVFLAVFSEISLLHSIVTLVLFGFFLGYGGYLSYLSNKSKARFRIDKDYNPFVSIMIPVHNEEKVIETTIKRAMSIDYSSYDVWVIDDRSTDKTPEILSRLKHQYKRLNVLTRGKESMPGKAAALNECSRMAKGVIHLIFDADAFFKNDVLRKSVIYLKDDNIAGAQVAKLISNPHKNFLTKEQYFEFLIDIAVQRGRDKAGGMVEFKGNGTFVKKDFLEKVGGWNEYSLTEDLDLSMRVYLEKMNIRFIEEVVVSEQAVTTFKDLFRQRFRWMEGSLIRYLSYINEFIKVKMPVSQIVDLFFFTVEFIFPFWFITQILTEVVKLFVVGRIWLGGIAFSFLTMILIVSSKLVQIMLERKMGGFFFIAKRIFSNVIYMSHWIFIDILALLHILFSKTQARWHRSKKETQ